MMICAQNIPYNVHKEDFYVLNVPFFFMKWGKYDPFT